MCTAFTFGAVLRNGYMDDNALWWEPACEAAPDHSSHEKPVCVLVSHCSSYDISW